MRKEFQHFGGDLLVVDAPPDLFFKALFTTLRDRSICLPYQVSFCRDYEPYARSRDTQITQIIEEHGVKVLSERDHLLVEPAEMPAPSGGTFYKVFSPFARRWLDLFEKPEFQERIYTHQNLASYPGLLSKPWHPDEGSCLKWKDLLKTTEDLFEESLDKFINLNKPKVSIEIPKSGLLEALKRLKVFEPCLYEYKENRDIPAIDGTSKMSIFLKNGSICSGQIFATLGLSSPAQLKSLKAQTFVKEIIWREFYYSILYHKPEVESQSFRTEYDKLRWLGEEDHFQKWKIGETGFPIVDAGMRQLNQTGWMHNRVRMIVASFLTKDLLIDWRKGEQYFMHKLLDGDLAPNNGGWQWAASTGCDPQPYFRIFNPWLQAKKFDPEGEYIKHYIPELRNCTAKAIHSPEPDARPKSYPRPIVDHMEQKLVALQMFKK